MELTLKQEEGLKIAVERYKNKEAYTVISGYAGTGKSTLVSVIIDALGIDRTQVAYVAYTGKAAHVLKSKGCPNATTAHKLLYNTIPKQDGTFYFRPKNILDEPYKLIVVDEVSMLPKDMWFLLLSHRVHVIALGDPEQLPSLSEDAHVLDHPHIFLDEVMRQAQESEILRISMDIREGRPLHYFKGNEVQILPYSELSTGMYKWADTVLVGMNATRHNINRAIREIKFGPDISRTPINGDQVICTRNYWNDACTAYGDPMVNGLVGTIFNVKNQTGQPQVPNITVADFQPIEYGSKELVKNAYFKRVRMDTQLYTTGEPYVNKDNFHRISQRLRPKEFEYGYALTVWKAQGSEYNKVLLLEESWPRDKDTKRKYLYTGVTRAIDKLVIVR